MSTFTRTTATILATAVAGFGAHQGAEAMFGIDHERVAQYNECIPHAGKVAMEQSVVPAQCEQLKDEFPTVRATGNKLVPSQATLTNERDGVIYDGKSLDTVRTVITGAGGLAGGGAVGYILFAGRRRKQAPRQQNLAPTTAQ